MANFDTLISKQDWMKVNPADFGPDAQAAHERMKASQASAKADRLTFESAVAANLVARGMIAEGRLPIFSRFGDIADPSLHTKPANGSGTTGGGKRTLVLAPLFDATKKRKA